MSALSAILEDFEPASTANGGESVFSQRLKAAAYAEGFAAGEAAAMAKVENNNTYLESVANDLQKVLEEEDNRQMDHFLKRAFETLKSAGIKKNQIEIKTRVWGHDVCSAILEEADSGRHGTIMVARRGQREAFFSGRIAMNLLQKVSNRTLWIVA